MAGSASRCTCARSAAAKRARRRRSISPPKSATTSAHDVSDGGLLIALAEMAISSGIGAKLLAAPAAIVPLAYWFGEDQARYIVTVREEEAGLVLAKMKGADVPCVRIGTTGGETIAIAGEAPVSIASLRAGFEGWFPAYMSGGAA
jgi:phosphoribosylformylglycinamidine synthase subunit PurL